MSTPNIKLEGNVSGLEDFIKAAWNDYAKSCNLSKNNQQLIAQHYASFLAGICAGCSLVDVLKQSAINEVKVIEKSYKGN